MKAVVLEGSAVNPGDISWDPVTCLCDTVVYDTTTEEEKWERLEGVDLVLTNKIIIDEAVFSRFPQIRYVGVCATGYNVVDLDAARRHGVTVCNVPAYSTDAVVQFTWALILEIASKVSLHSSSVRQGDWIHAKNFCYWLEPLMELSGKTLGIYGFGNIGQGVAKVAQAFGMNVLVYTAHPDRHLDALGRQLRFADENSLYRYSDIITYHCPLTEETKGIVNRDTISRMKDGAVLINVSRGPLVVEEDLAEALRSGKLAAAGVDVIGEEPMRPGHPFLEAPHLFVTPHIAWASREARMRLVNTVAANMAAFLKGEAQNVVS